MTHSRKKDKDVLKNIKKKGSIAKVEQKQTNRSNEFGKDGGHFTITAVDKKGGEIFAFLYFLILDNKFPGNNYSDLQKATLNIKR